MPDFIRHFLASLNEPNSEEGRAEPKKRRINPNLYDNVIVSPTVGQGMEQVERDGHSLAHSRATMDTRDMNTSMELRPPVATDRKACLRQLNAIILCEDGGGAFQNAPHLLMRFGEHLDIHPKTWTFESLNVPTSRAAALQTAREAGVILVSAQDDAELPSSVQNFLRQAVATRPELPKPIALLTESNADSGPLTSQVSRKLRRLANSAGTEFFVLAPPDAPSQFANSPTRSDPSASAATSQRHWGINE